MNQGMFQTPQQRQEMKLAPRMMQALSGIEEVELGQLCVCALNISGLRSISGFSICHTSPRISFARCAATPTDCSTRCIGAKPRKLKEFNQFQRIS